MIKLNKNILFLIFALCLFALGAKISLLIQNGIEKGANLVFNILIMLSLVISAVVLFNKIYKKQKNNSKL